MTDPTGLRNRIVAAWKRAFKQFLALPLLVVVGFVALSAVIYVADDTWSRGEVPPGFGWLGDILGDSGALSALLATIASSIITVTSITFSLLLVALQQGASALTSQVTDQFLMRRVNQFYFGFFVGLSVYVLLTLVTVSNVHRPVFGTSAALVLTMAALCMIVVMIYNTIEQMRPVPIVHAIHQHVLRARQFESKFIAESRREPRTWPVASLMYSPETGHLKNLDLPALRKRLDDLHANGVELELLVPLGTYLAFNDPVFALRAAPGSAPDAEVRKKIEDAAQASIAFDDDRDLTRDPLYGLYQLSTIAWTSVSTAKSNPGPGQAVISSLRDIISRWGVHEANIEEDPASPLVYADRAPGVAINALETIILVASESMQAQTLTDAIDTLSILLHSAPAGLAERLADVARRGLSSLGEHVLTRDLEASLDRLAAALEQRDFVDVSDAVRRATAELAATLGTLNSRSTRVQAKS